MINRKNFDEGLGTVYERFMLNNFFDVLMASNRIRNVLEVPLFGMTGLTGINSVQFARKGCRVCLLEPDRERADEANGLWSILPLERDRYEILCHEDLCSLPFADETFDLVWNFAALWHIRNPGALLSEMARVSSNLILIFMPNPMQIGYFLRKYLLDREFFGKIDETCVKIENIDALIKSSGHDFPWEEQGVLDIPPWPDTCFPIAPLLRKLKGKECEEKESWEWDIMSYYMGSDNGLKDKIERLSFLETSSIPLKIKALWAHHRYVMFSKKRGKEHS